MVIHIVLFGFENIGKIHYNNLINSNYFKLTNIIEKKDISKEIDSSIIYVNSNDKKSLDDIFNNKRIQAIIITSSIDTNYKLIKKALEYNKHIFVENSISQFNYDIEECFRIANSKNLKLFLGYNRRYDNSLQDIKRQIEEGEIGKINYALSISRYNYKNFFNQNTYEIFKDCAIYDIDCINWILNDKPISVWVNTSDNDSNKIYNYDYVTINLKYSLGTIVCLNLSRISSTYDIRYEFYGSKGDIINSNSSSSKVLNTTKYLESFKNELEAFYLCIVNNKNPIVTLNDCINNNIIVSACEESSNKQKKITIKYGNGFRNYNNSTQSVKNNYYLARKNQTLDFVLNMKTKYSNLNLKMEIWDILEDLNNLIDVSDPDCSHPNLYHAIQTAEMIRKDGHPDWMQLIGLLHDIGKIMYKKGNNELGTGLNNQWAMVGDTFIVGCKIPDSIIFPEFNCENPDMTNKQYNTKLGIYSEKCGFDNLHSSWGHDEYLYNILKSDKNKNILPEEALYIIRWHSLYLYHDKEEYLYFQSEKDKQMLPILKSFNKYDLYSKCDDIYDIDNLKDYYLKLIKKFFLNTYLYI